jgi:hypothetical protein
MVVINASGVMVYMVTLAGTDISSGELPAAVSEGETFSFELVADQHYRLPGTIVITMGGVTLTHDTDYTCDN